MNPHDFFDHLVELHNRTFEIGQYEVSFHLLSAALHVAVSDSNVSAVSRIHDLATQRADELDRADPPHTMSSHGARSRGTDPVFRSLTLHAHASRLRLETQDLMARPKPAWPDAQLSL